jgi:E3 ubiquitin-protein ligase TRIP12
MNKMHLETPPQPMPPNNILMSAIYQQSMPDPSTSGNIRQYHHHHSMVTNYPPQAHPQQHTHHHHLPSEIGLVSFTNNQINHEASGSGGGVVPPVTTPSSSSTSAGAAGNPTNTLKMSDILKRKVPPKRKSQNTGKSKNRTDDGAGTSSGSQAPQSQSMMQDFIQKATNLGTSGRNTPSTSGSSSSRSRFSGASSKTSSFLASLNPVRWGRSSSHATFSKDASNNLSKSASNSNLIAAGNREKARQWIRDQSIAFVHRYADHDSGIGGAPHPALSILARLTNAIHKLDGSLNDCQRALEELRNILMESDISPFEVNHSGLIKAMITFMTSEGVCVARNDRLRTFLNVFAGLPLDGK